MKDPATWKSDEDFLATERVVRGLIGVNDPAEHMCGVAKEFLVRIFYNDCTYMYFYFFLNACTHSLVYKPYP